jgi:prepilin-type processing-associated H-X9-DG protein
MKTGVRSEKGFSLLELMIIVATACILVALLFPATKQWMAKAQVAQCVSNLRGIGQAAFSYASDNDGRLPSVEVGNVDAETRKAAGTAGNDRLMMAVYPYAPAQKLYRCKAFAAETTDTPFKNGQYHSTYNQNVYTFGARLGTLAGAAHVILAYEGYPFLSITGSPPSHHVNSSYYPISSVSPSHPPKVNGIRSSNALMADGHVETGLMYFGWGNSKNTIPADGGIWGSDKYTFNL